jgi:hypothetical protein
MYKGINTPFIALFADLEIMHILSAITRLNHSRGGLFWFAIHGFVMQISYRYQSADLEIDDWRM